MRYIVRSALAFILCCSPASAGPDLRHSYHPDCPTVGKIKTWAEFLTPPRSADETPIVFSIIFMNYSAKTPVNRGWHEPRWAGDILSGGGYNFILANDFMQSEGPIKSRQCISSNREQFAIIKKFELPVMGQVLRYDNMGFVYAENTGWDHGWGVVGRLNCHWRPLEDRRYIPASLYISDFSACSN